MSAKHTPGPWEVSPWTTAGGTIVAGVAIDKLSLYITSHNPNLVDDAHLVAAAPDLLAACETIGAFVRDLLKLVTSEQIEAAGLQRKMLRASEQGFKALNKAKGGK